MNFLLNTLIVIVILICGWILFLVIDVFMLPIKISNAEIIKKEFVPDHCETTVTYDVCLHMPMTHVNHFPDQWLFNCKLFNKVDQVEVSEYIYNKRNVGESISVNYSMGRIRKSHLYIQSVNN